ncbi:MAG: FAD-dependent oxidoreductase, partial [Clostridia bacterium]|nr:FAD-dependent oxidoreductase [Clostridia bacterium]
CKDVVILNRDPQLGGILMQCIHAGFGLHKMGREMTGPEYAAVYEKMVKDRGIKVYSETMVLSLTPDKVVTFQGRSGYQSIKAKSVILAMGCRERSRGAIGIPGDRPAGVYSAGCAQRLINIEGFSVGKRAVILGSGDIGLIMARRMTLEGAKVEAVCELMSYSGGLTRNIVQCLEDFGIPLYLSTTVTKIHGRERLEGVTIAQVGADRKIVEGSERYIPCDTLLLSVGLIPENEVTLSAGIEMDRVTSGAMVDENRQTSIPGVFSCGNVLQVHDLVDFVSDEGEIAGLAAASFAKGELKEGASTNVKVGNGVRYVLPQRIHTDKNQKIDLYFRVAAPYGKVKITAKCGDQILASAVKPRVAPGEMEKITLSENLFPLSGEEITVGLEEIK